MSHSIFKGFLVITLLGLALSEGNFATAEQTTTAEAAAAAAATTTESSTTAAAPGISSSSAESGGESCSTCAKDPKTAAGNQNATASSTAKSTTTTSNNNNGTGGSSIDYQEELVEWLLSKPNGFFNKQKIRFQPIYPGGPNGMFAIEPIQMNETLIVVPNECLLTSDLNHKNNNGGHSSSPNVDDGDYEPSRSMCDTARHLAQEYIQWNTTGQSKYAPYVRSVFEQKQYEKLPAAWSEYGLTLLQSVIGDELEPQGLDDIDFWRVRCPQFRGILKEIEDPQEREEMAQLYTDAYRIVVSRSWNDVIIPVYDNLNHRNGRYHNVDQLNSAHDDDADVVIVALRDVEPGEQLYISYNECHDEDCDGIAHSYILPHILKDYGFCEQYPRRWRFSESIGDEEYDQIVFELEQDEATGEISLTWLSDEPDSSLLRFLRGHLVRQREIHNQLIEEINKLPAPHERETIMEYHDALMVALELAVQEAGREDSKLKEPEKECVVEAGGSQTCIVNTQGRYDPLMQSDGQSEKQGRDDEGSSICSSDHSRYLGDGEYEFWDETDSFYQTITFEHNQENDDTCLYLSSWFQTCSSFRPHYHESVVHVPASFLEKVTRVLYLGGGDNMMLHEVLKYSNTLKMVLGLELDQHVVRSSFKVLGNQPHFDNKKVHWWFGDATKSLKLLPSHYFGTFDLILLDLQTNVLESLKVTPTKTIMEFALDLLKPEGIVSRNEDFYPRRSLGFTAYEVDLEYLDVPMLCQQSITIGSKTVDFLTKEPKSHGIESKNLYHTTAPKAFNDWYGYRNNLGFKDVEYKQESLEGEDAMPNENCGVDMILEVENAVLDSKPVEETLGSISAAISAVGFAEMSVTVLSAAKDDWAFFLFQEGYLLAQLRPSDSYVGFHLKLWSQLEKLEIIKAKLISAVEGTASSSFRIVTGGMSGLQEMNKERNGPDAAELRNSLQKDQQASVREDAEDWIVRESLSLAPLGSAVLVVCPEKAVRCPTMEVLFKHNVHLTRKLIPLYACAGLEEDAMMYPCETELLKGLKVDLKIVGSKVGGIIFDRDSPKAVGQILLTLLSDKSIRISLLGKDYVVVFTSQESNPLWQRSLLARFQSMFDPISPSLRTQAFFNSTNGNMELGVFSSGNPTFYSDLVSMLKRVEKETGLPWGVRKIEDGAIGYVAEFYPDVIPSNADYDKTDALDQWSSQTPLGHETIFQFGIEMPQSHLEEGEIVLVEYSQDVWKGEWGLGRVVEEKARGKYTVEFEDEELEVERNSIRRLDFTSEIEVMDQVLIRRGDYWSQGVIIEKAPNGKSFEVRRFDSNGAIMTVKRKNIVPRLQASDGSKDAPSLMTVDLPEAIISTLEYIGVDIDREKNFHSFWGIGAGCIIVAFWSWGSAIATWDGQSHLDVCFFTNHENGGIRRSFVEGITDEIPILVVVSRDDHPRGFGRVVNFPTELEEAPSWAGGESATDSEDE